MILGGEQSVSADEPVRSINQYLDELEQDPRILSCSWHVGYIRHDTDVAGCGIVVVPATEADQAYAEEVADKLADYVWNKRHEFHYTGTTAKPEDALAMALSFEGKPFVITDSGDNTTSGATGWNTFILRQALAAKSDKRILFASICDPKTCDLLDGLDLGTKTEIELGVGHDAMSEKVSWKSPSCPRARSSGRSASEPKALPRRLASVSSFTWKARRSISLSLITASPTRMRFSLNAPA